MLTPWLCLLHVLLPLPQHTVATRFLLHLPLLLHR
jgi:hypothetical protein